jgi:hypothetical protein
MVSMFDDAAKAEDATRRPKTAPQMAKPTVLMGRNPFSLWRIGEYRGRRGKCLEVGGTPLKASVRDVCILYGEAMRTQ